MYTGKIRMTRENRPPMSEIGGEGQVKCLEKKREQKKE